jgi:hypothetical protein
MRARARIAVTNVDMSIMDGLKSRECNNFTFIFCKEIIKTSKHLARALRASSDDVVDVSASEHLKKRHIPMLNIFAINSTVNLYYNFQIPLTIPVPLYGFRAEPKKKTSGFRSPGSREKNAGPA